MFAAAATSRGGGGEMSAASSGGGDGAGGPRGQPDVTMAVSMERWLPRHDPVWEFGWAPNQGQNKIPTFWYESAYIGNGMMGAMLTVENRTCGCPIICDQRCACPAGCELPPALPGTAVLRWDVNRVDAWSDSGVTMPLGHLELDTGVAWDEPSDGNRFSIRTSLHSGTMEGTVGSALGFRAWIDASELTDSVLRIELSGASAKRLAAGLVWVPCPTINVSALPEQGRGYVVPAQCKAAIQVAVAPVTRGGTTVSTKAHVLNDGVGGAHHGNCSAGGMAIAVAHSRSSTSSRSSSGQSSTTSTETVALASSNQCWNSSADAGSAVARAVAAAQKALVGPSRARARHLSWWSTFWNESYVGISGPDATRVESLYYNNMYRYASACRHGIHDLTGAFGPGGMSMQWGVNFLDMNVEVNLFALHASNHLGLSNPFVEAMDAIAETPANSAAVMFPGNLPSGWPLLWCLKSYWRFTTNDPGRQNTLFALLKIGLGGVTLTNTTSPDGTVHVLGIGSPEYPNFSGTTDTNFGLAIVRWAARTLVAVGTGLGGGATHDPAIALYRSVLNRMVPFSADGTGFMLDRTHQFLLPHRHWSHIIMIYDLELAEGRFNHTAGANNTLVTTSIDHWAGLTCNTTAVTCVERESCRGFSRGAVSIMSAMLGRAEAAMTNLTALLDTVVTPNGMYGEGVTSNARGSQLHQLSPCPESAYIASAALHEQFLHSVSAHEEVVPATAAACTEIRVFPASGWAEAEFHKLRALDGFLISGRKAAGSPTSFVRIEALRPEGGSDSASGPTASKSVTLFTAGWDSGRMLPVVVPSTVKLSPVPGGGVTFTLRVGSHVILYHPPPPRSATSRTVDAAPAPAFEIAVLPANGTEFHWLGYRNAVTDEVMQCSGGWPGPQT